MKYYIFGAIVGLMFILQAIFINFFLIIIGSIISIAALTYCLLKIKCEINKIITAYSFVNKTILRRNQ